MATAQSSTDADVQESCSLCSSKYKRSRPSFCKCQHCSISLCIDCTKEHHDILLQDVYQVSHEYNQIKELVQKKQRTIADETAQSIEDVNKYFETYIDELGKIRQQILLNIEQAKQDALTHILKIDSDLSSLGTQISALAKQNVAHATKTGNISTQLKSIEESVNTYQARRVENLAKIRPEFSMKFEYPAIVTENISESSATITRETASNNTIQTNSEISVSNSSPQQISELNQVMKIDNLGDAEDSTSSNYTDCEIVKTKYIIDRMASDGENILYTTCWINRPDMITYKSSDNCEQERDWNQSRIEDMIWWDSIDKFICATNDGIYSVEYINGKLKILCVIHDKWSYCRVAANTTSLFLWIYSDQENFYGMDVYSVLFDRVSTIDFNNTNIGSYVGNSVSFCVTDNLIASLCTRKQSNREVFKITVCDLEMNQLHSIPLGKYGGHAEIRTNGVDRFFVTTGHRRFYIVDTDGTKEEIYLAYEGDRIAVFNNGRVAISNRSDEMEIITY